MAEQEKWVGSKSLALLRQGPFRRYIIGSLISDSGTWMQMMAQSWVMSGLTGKAILLGLVNFAAGLPAKSRSKDMKLGEWKLTNFVWNRTTDHWNSTNCFA